MKKRRYILAGGALVLAILAVWWLAPVKAQVLGQMPVLLLREDTGALMASSLHMRGTWTSWRYQDTLRFSGNFMARDIAQTHIGGGDQYQLTLIPQDGAYVTARSELHISSAAPVVKSFQLQTNRERSAFLGAWDIYLDGPRHKPSRVYWIAPARNVEEARSLIRQFPVLMADIEAVLSPLTP